MRLWNIVSNSLDNINVPVTVMSALLGAFLGIVAVYFTFNAHVVSLIDQRISSDKYLKKIAEQLRPSMIFDQKESILIDNGASKYIENIHVKTKNTSGKEVLDHIIIIPKMYLQIYPFLESLDQSYRITPERGKKFEIIYRLENTQFVGGASNRRFRLEIIR